MNVAMVTSLGARAMAGDGITIGRHRNAVASGHGWGTGRHDGTARGSGAAVRQGGNTSGSVDPSWARLRWLPGLSGSSESNC